MPRIGRTSSLSQQDANNPQINPKNPMRIEAQTSPVFIFTFFNIKRGPSGPLFFNLFGKISFLRYTRIILKYYVSINRNRRFA